MFSFKNDSLFLRLLMIAPLYLVIGGSFSLLTDNKAVGMDAIKTKKIGGDIGNLEPYKHLNVQEQIKLYDHVYKKGITSQDKHIDGLFGILQRAFSLVRDRIETKGQLINSSIEMRLKELYQVAKDANAKKLFSVAYFMTILVKLAEVVDYANDPKNNKLYDVEPQNFKWNKLSLPVVILSNPDINKPTMIGYETFIEAYFNENGHRRIVQFEPNSAKHKALYEKESKRGTKKLAHYGGFSSSTVKFFSHDIDHLSRSSENDFKQTYKIDYDAEVKKVYNLWKKLKDEKSKTNEAEVIKNALFLLIQEQVDVFGKSGEIRGRMGGVWIDENLPKNIYTLLNTYGKTIDTFFTTEQRRSSYDKADMNNKIPFYIEFIRDLERIFCGKKMEEQKLVRFRLMDAKGEPFVEDRTHCDMGGLEEKSEEISSSGGKPENYDIGEMYMKKKEPRRRAFQKFFKSVVDIMNKNGIEGYPDTKEPWIANVEIK